MTRSNESQRKKIEGMLSFGAILSHLHNSTFSLCLFSNICHSQTRPQYLQSSKKRWDTLQNNRREIEGWGVRSTSRLWKTGWMVSSPPKVSSESTSAYFGTSSVHTKAEGEEGRQVVIARGPMVGAFSPSVRQPCKDLQNRGPFHPSLCSLSDGERQRMDLRSRGSRSSLEGKGKEREEEVS